MKTIVEIITTRVRTYTPWLQKQMAVTSPGRLKLLSVALILGMAAANGWIVWRALKPNSSSFAGEDRGIVMPRVEHGQMPDTTGEMLRLRFLLDSLRMMEKENEK